ncbi:hypothetical protein POM88_053806 [Heracleum sosnowskyi]|uniref:Uncharacterized protein n=1 Tax=Heracleum sosnowskyi TaxID=360622 RepID=A0AAD8GPK0_9APIA|nr:hypothetical protein POM88_053806 [Heracleum sosnowskyi]
MGRWNNRRRWAPRRHDNDDHPRRSPPTYYQTKVDPQEVLRNSSLPWEQKFCLLGGIPWYKVLAAKKYIYCHENVLKWDDAAAKDALFDAQERFCSMINNSLPQAPPLPDPDMYIDKIDWNPEIDPGLMSDLDKEYFNPDEAENLTSNEIPDCNNKNKSTLDNPWESYLLENNVDIKDLAQSWNKWGDSLESKNATNLWEQPDLNGDEASKDKKWGSSVNKPFGWNEGLNDTRGSTKYESDHVNSWNQGASHSKLPNEKGWGDASKKSGGWNDWGNAEYTPVLVAKGKNIKKIRRGVKAGNMKAPTLKHINFGGRKDHRDNITEKFVTDFAVIQVISETFKDHVAIILYCA